MKKAIGIQTILLIIYFSVTPLLVSFNPIVFHEIKLLLIYSCISVLFLFSLFDFHEKKEEYYSNRRIFIWELRLVVIALFLMFISFFINFNQMNTLISGAEFGSVLWKGAGPNYLSLFFYVFSFLFISISISFLNNINFSLISKSIVGSLIVVGCIIFYQIFINDFLGNGINYLFGWGNSNYTPDPFSIIGLMLLIPLLLTKKINFFHLTIGIFFFEIVLLSSSRASFIALFLSISISFLILIIKRRISLQKILIIYGIAALIILFSYQLFLHFGFEIGFKDLTNLNSITENNIQDSYSLYNRFDLWLISLKNFSENIYTILFGIGQSVYTYNTETMHFLVSNTHNQYIDILLSSGVLVFGIFIVLIYRQFTYALKLLNFDIKYIVYLACLIFICVKWMFNSLNAIHSPFVFLVFILISYRYSEILPHIQNIHQMQEKGENKIDN